MKGVPGGRVDGYGIKTMLRPAGEYFLSLSAATEKKWKNETIQKQYES
jgi:hypothetical protein